MLSGKMLCADPRILSYFVWCFILLTQHQVPVSVLAYSEETSLSVSHYETKFNWEVKVLKPLMDILLKPVTSDSRVKRSNQAIARTSPSVNPIWVPISPVDSTSSRPRRPIKPSSTFKSATKKKILKNIAQKKDDSNVYDYYPYESISFFVGHEFSVLGLIAILATGLLYVLFFVYIVTTTSTTASTSGRKGRKVFRANEFESQEIIGNIFSLVCC